MWFLNKINEYFIKININVIMQFLNKIDEYFIKININIILI